MTVCKIATVGFARFHSVDNFFKACRDSRVVDYLSDKLDDDEAKAFKHVISTKLINSPAVRESVSKWDEIFLQEN